MHVFALSSKKGFIWSCLQKNMTIAKKNCPTLHILKDLTFYLKNFEQNCQPHFALFSLLSSKRKNGRLTFLQKYIFISCWINFQIGRRSLGKLKDSKFYKTGLGPMLTLFYGRFSRTLSFFTLSLQKNVHGYHVKVL